MHLGLQLPTFSWPGGPQKLGETFGRIAEQAEHAGLYSLWTMDHVLGPRSVGPIEQEVLEGWSTLAFAAARTRQIKLGVLATAVTFRHPGLLVKMATTLDVLSGGRSYFGIGAGWFEEENPAYGMPFPPLKERFERLEETVQIALQMWSGNEQPYEGTYYQLARPLNSPQALQKPHPPILIAGGGERRTLQLVARYADACNLFTHEGPEVLRHKLEILREHCETIGRPYEQVEKTAHSVLLHFTRDGRNGTLSPTAALDFFAELAELGISHVIISIANVHEPEALELLATEIIPAVEKISVTSK